VIDNQNLDWSLRRFTPETDTLESAR